MWIFLFCIVFLEYTYGLAFSLPDDVICVVPYCGTDFHTSIGCIKHTFSQKRRKNLSFKNVQLMIRSTSLLMRENE